MTTGPSRRPEGAAARGPLTDRRTFIAGALALAGASLLDPLKLTAARQRAAALPLGDLFPLGVASGDPTEDSVILWTRLVSPDPAGDPLPEADIPVRWFVSSTPDLTDVVASGTAPAVAALGHSVHVEATGLYADTTYYFIFALDEGVPIGPGSRFSPVARTRTFPEPDSSPDEVRFALASCQNFSDGYYTAHQNLALEDVQFVVFVGDYIYESSANRPPRPFSLATSVDLPTYRARYEYYKADADLQACHHAHPWILTVDDHEVANNVLGDLGRNGEAAGDPVAIAAYRVRRADAFQAWYEHQPLRLPAPTGADYVIYRTVEHSKLLRFFVLDGRQYRSAYPEGGGSVGVDTPARHAEGQTMLGSTQEAWLDQAFAATDTRWNAVAQQTVMTETPIPVGDAIVYNLDQWDGYVAGRERLLRSLVAHEVNNPMILSGDIHLAAAAAVRLDYADPSAPDIAQEVVATSISSRVDPALYDLVQSAVEATPWVRYGNALRRGYSVITVTASEWTTDFRGVDVSTPVAVASTDFTDVVTAREPVEPPEEPTTPTTSTPTSPPPPASTTVPSRPRPPMSTRPGATRPAAGARPVRGSATYTG